MFLLQAALPEAENGARIIETRWSSGGVHNFMSQISLGFVSFSSEAYPLKQEKMMSLKSGQYCEISVLCVAGRMRSFPASSLLRRFPHFSNACVGSDSSFRLC